MGKFNKNIYMKGCHLITKINDDTSNMYQFVFNPDTAEFSNIYACSDGLDFEIEEDGIYNVVTFRSLSATLNNGVIQLGTLTIDAQNFVERINISNSTVNTLQDVDFEIDEVLSICKLKKCLANLELKTFQEMLKNCGKSKCKNDDVKSQRDFLFIAV